MQTLTTREPAQAAGVAVDTIRCDDREGLPDDVARDAATNRELTAEVVR